MDFYKTWNTMGCFSFFTKETVERTVKYFSPRSQLDTHTHTFGMLSNLIPPSDILFTKLLQDI